MSSSQGSSRLTPLAPGRSLTNFASRDGKRISYSKAGVAQLAISLIIKLPLVLLILLPTHLVYFVAIKLFGKKKVPFLPDSDYDTRDTLIPEAKGLVSREERPFDLVLYGVTGFAGGFAAQHAAKKYPTDVRWAIAGRNREALEKVKASLVEINADLKDLEIILADARDEKSLAKMCARTKVVASTVGPFVKYGTGLVRQCIANKCDYVDTTGEIQWIKVMVEKYHVQARQAGVRIISLCGHDSIPWDLMVRQIAVQIKKENADEELVDVELYNDLRGGGSGGTLATAIELIERERPKSKLGYNPMRMDVDGNEGLGIVVNKLSGPGYSKKNKAWYTFFVMSGVNKECTGRSNILNHYSSKFSYKEQLVLPNFTCVIISTIDFMIAGSFVLNSWLRSIAFSAGILPKPGAGPSVEVMNKSFLQITGYGTGSKGTEVTARIYFPNDPGYRDTGRMVVESGIALALQRNDLPAGMDGLVSPAAGLGEVLLSRLCDTGTEYEIVVSKKVK